MDVLALRSGRDHPFNPHVYLRSTLSPDALAHIMSGGAPLMVSFANVAAKKRKAVRRRKPIGGVDDHVEPPRGRQGAGASSSFDGGNGSGGGGGGDRFGGAPPGVGGHRDMGMGYQGGVGGGGPGVGGAARYTMPSSDWQGEAAAMGYSGHVR